MAKVILTMEGQVLREYPLAKERTTVGRRPHNDIVIENLAISGEHAVIVTILNDSFLEDLGSTNGTMVNGAPVKKHFLQNNDVIELGKYRIRYLADNGRGGEEYDKTMVIRPGSIPGNAMQGNPAAAALNAAADTDFGNTAPVIPDAARGAPPAPRPPAPKPDASKPDLGRAMSATQEVMAAKLSAQIQSADTQYMEPDSDALFGSKPPVKTKNFEGKVRILNGGNAGKEMQLVKMVTTIGRPGGQVAVISKKPDGFYVSHVEGPVTPIINGSPIGTEPMRLASTDVLEIAGVRMEFTLI
ncbi:MAG: FHA domain-containing protein [Burkholderiaceae bacterium]